MNISPLQQFDKRLFDQIMNVYREMRLPTRETPSIAAQIKDTLTLNYGTFELTPQPFGAAENKLLFQYKDVAGIPHINVSIHPNAETNTTQLTKSFDDRLRQKFYQ